jgi:hypothetical protein
MDDEKILSYWDLPEFLDDRQRGILFYLLPIVHKIRGHFHLMEETYVAILKDKVEIRKGEMEIKSVDTSWERNVLGNFNLAGNFVLGYRKYNIFQNLLIEIGPVNIENIFDYLPGRRNRQIIDHLNSLFMPVTAETETRVIMEKREWRLQSKDNCVSRLGYSVFT